MKSAMNYKTSLLLLVSVTPFVAPLQAAHDTQPATTSVAAAPASAPATAAWTAAQPITLAQTGNSYLNLSVVGDLAAGASSRSTIERVQQGGHDPAQRGFSIQGLEVVFDGAVDNYFRATANIAYALDTHGESFLELEEAYAETLSMPHGLQFRAGQYFTEFGRINAQHPHSWDFVDTPLVNARFLGPDGLRNPGARLSWLTPTPFYSELFLGVQNSQGETAHSFRSDHEDEAYAGRLAAETRVRGLRDMLYTARYAASAELSDTQTLLGGVSGAWGPNSTGGNAHTQLYGADLFWKWKPADHNKGFPFISVQGEVLLRGFKAAAATAGSEVEPVELPAETFWDWGTYAQVNYGFREGWVASLRADFVTPVSRADYEKILGERDPERERRWRISPALTWFPSEFSRVRVQYNYDHFADSRDSHGVWVQLEFLLGAHAAHKF
jgi:hypothetical protein